MATKSSQELADIILARQSVALARSQRLLQSWLPPRDPTAAPASTAEDDDDFEGMTELAGLGSKRKAEDEGVLGGLKRKKLSGDDKLLEQLLGKKAAQARKKAREGTSRAMKPMPKKAEVKGREAESEDEEKSRAAAFESRKRKGKPAPAPVVEEDGKADEVIENKAVATTLEHVSPPPAKKQKPASYLDELLAQRAGMKKKKKNKKQQQPDAAKA